MAELEVRASSGGLAELRQELARVRAESQKEIALLRAQLAATNARELSHDGRVAAERLALEQEVNALRRALVEKDRTLDGISQECRRLEDAIEDEHQAADTLRQNLQRIEADLAAAQEYAADLQRERDELRTRLLNRLSGGARGKLLSKDSPAPFGKIPVFATIAILLLLIAVAAVVDHFGLGTFFGEGNVIGADRPARIADTTKSTASSDEAANATSQNVAGTEVEVVEPKALPTLRDRFADGTAGPLMVALPAGDFRMGSRGLSGDRDEHPEHQVRVGSFLIGAHEVTFADYDRFARATDRRFPMDFGWGREGRPVVDVTWEDAQAYAQWLSQQTGHRYRLPSEAEWEYAARGGTRLAYWWGSNVETGRALCFECGTPWDARSTAPTGSFEPNPYGLYDTAGNVLEWTDDCYHPNYQGAPTDGTAWTDGDCQARVARGGAFNKPANSMRSAARANFAPDTRINMMGFRVARDE